MRRFLTSTFLFFVIVCAQGQDANTTNTTSNSYSHEIGFNAMRLLDIISFIDAPVDQLPYDVFYNYYFNDRWGMRLGAGILKQSTQTDIPGQIAPRKTTVSNLNLRLGVTTNFARAGSLTFNGFADLIWNNAQNTSVSTTTMQVFGDPVVTTTVKSKESAMGIGGQVGLGLNWRIYKNLCVYTEVPLTFVAVDRSSRDEVSDDAGNYDVNSQSVNSTEFRIIIPATIYLVLRF